jgi:predicted nucleic acid-binding protein
LILLDTSAWVEFFRPERPADLERVGTWDQFVTCLPVIQEVLQGIRDEPAFRRVSRAVLALPRVEDPITQELVLEAIDMYRRARRAALTVRSSVDCLIAACALRHDLEIVHRDRDFPALAHVVPLRQRALPG